MKIRDIITEEVDMSWQAEIDADFNPEALQSVKQQEKRQQILAKMGNGTTVFHRPVRNSETSFSNTPPKDQPKSPGYIGNVHTSVRAGNTTPEEGVELTEIS